ncbi:MAG: LD-carboxypeptidase, partial [Desulfobacterales bacterium]|nr:LD-carboxypeptidase [Desulfobacterales bacterium]
PKRLEKSDNIGIVAPASHFDLEKFNKGIDVLKIMGFNVIVPEEIYQKKRYLAGSDEMRADLVNKFFADENIDAIICARGGFGSIRILKLLDYELIRNHPKIFCGFSDISNLLNVIYHKCFFVTFHGPNILSLANATEKTKDSMFYTLSDYTKAILKPDKPITIKAGIITAPVMGGNLTTLCHLIGTQFLPSFKNHIVFLEDRGESLYKIDRCLVQMKLSGCFNDVRGLIIGSFNDCGNMDDLYGLVYELFSEYGFPIIAGFEIGHDNNNMTVPIGLLGKIDTYIGILSFDENN